MEHVVEGGTSLDLDASDTSASRADGPRQPPIPKDPSKGEPRGTHKARGVTEVRSSRGTDRPKQGFATVFHGLYVLVVFGLILIPF